VCGFLPAAFPFLSFFFFLPPSRERFDVPERLGKMPLLYRRSSTGREFAEPDCGSSWEDPDGRES